MAKATSAAKAATPKGIKKNKKLTLMIIPFVILVFLFSYFPLHGWIYAFYDYKPPLPAHASHYIPGAASNLLRNADVFRSKLPEQWYGPVFRIPELFQQGSYPGA